VQQKQKKLPIRFLIFALVIFPMLCSNVFAKTDVGVKAGTLGLGLEITSAISPYISSRFSLNNFSYEYKGTREDVDFQVPVRVRSLGSLIDVHPFRGIFHISAGLFANQNSFKLKASGEEVIVLGGSDYKGEFTINGEMLFRKMAPYLGIGWSPAPSSKSSWGFSADIGVMFHGTPKLQAVASGKASNTKTNTVIENVLTDSEFLDDLNSEIARYQKNIDDFALSGFYPVLSFGFILQF